MFIFQRMLTPLWKKHIIYCLKICSALLIYVFSFRDSLLSCFFVITNKVADVRKGRLAEIVIQLVSYYRSCKNSETSERIRALFSGRCTARRATTTLAYRGWSRASSRTRRNSARTRGSTRSVASSRSSRTWRSTWSCCGTRCSSRAFNSWRTASVRTSYTHRCTRTDVHAPMYTHCYTEP